ncbi:unnamed protein product [Lactuca virosa]|uniref:Uncharacterized protein n=1 Tax=Lactuca virosa TaxID=75947 RepID=A0AAU9MMB1_9ASTR|nr:unnamed protein product [Lactuca virosa]
MQRLWMQKQNGLSWDLDICPSIRREIEDLRELQRFWVPYVSGYKEFEVFSGNERVCIPLRCTICHQTGHNKSTCPSKPTPAPSTAGPSQLTPAPSTAGPSQSTPAPSTPTPIVNEVPLKKAPVKRTPVKKAPVKRSPMKKVSLNDAGRVRKFLERIIEIGLQKNVKVKDGTRCSQDKPVTLE